MELDLAALAATVTDCDPPDSYHTGTGPRPRSRPARLQPRTTLPATRRRCPEHPDRPPYSSRATYCDECRQRRTGCKFCPAPKAECVPGVAGLRVSRHCGRPECVMRAAAGEPLARADAIQSGLADPGSPKHIPALVAYVAGHEHPTPVELLVSAILTGYLSLLIRRASRRVQTTRAARPEPAHVSECRTQGATIPEEQFRYGVIIPELFDDQDDPGHHDPAELRG